MGYFYYYFYFLFFTVNITINLCQLTAEILKSAFCIGTLAKNDASKSISSISILLQVNGSFYREERKEKKSLLKNDFFILFLVKKLPCAHLKNIYTIFLVQEFYLLRPLCSTGRTILVSQHLKSSVCVCVCIKYTLLISNPNTSLK